MSQIAPRVMPALFGLPERPRDYAEWELYPSFAGICQRHYPQLRTKHGTELGYRMRRGQPVAYIKDRYF